MSVNEGVNPLVEQLQNVGQDFTDVADCENGHIGGHVGLGDGMSNY